MLPDPDSLRLEIPRRLAGSRFDKVLAELVPDRSGAQLQKLVRRGRVKVDGKKVVRSNFRVNGGEVVAVKFGAPEEASLAAELTVLHVDDELVVIDKPPGMLVYPTERSTGGTLSELAVARFGPLPSSEDEDRPGIVHRLDRETSGVIVLARTDDALDHLRNQFRARTVEKAYHAVAYGVPAEERFDVDLALAPIKTQPDLQRPDPAGKPARTSFHVLAKSKLASLLECRPETGRRHQIRVHLATRGHPIIGDKLYRPDRSKKRIEGMRRHALHAQRLIIEHPRTKDRMAFETPPPADFRALSERLGLA